MSRLARIALLALLVLAPVAVPAPVWTLRAQGSQSASLSPEQKALLQRVRDNAIADFDVMEGYSYVLERRSYNVTLGKVRNGDVRTYEVVPSPFLPGRQWRRLVAVNGKPLTADELRRQDARARRDAENHQRRLARETAPERARRLAEERKEEQEFREQVADVERVFRFEPRGHETVDGRRLAVFELIPQPQAQTKSKEGRLLKKWRGRGWVEEAEAQLVRLQMDAFDDLDIGWGVIGHLDRGSSAEYRRARQADGTWLPVSVEFRGGGRTLLLLPFQIHTWAKYNSYRPVAATAAGHSGHGR